jgi:hypothetical protein
LKAFQFQPQQYKQNDFLSIYHDFHQDLDCLVYAFCFPSFRRWFIAGTFSSAKSIVSMWFIFFLTCTSHCSLFSVYYVFWTPMIGIRSKLDIRLWQGWLVFVGGCQRSYQTFATKSGWGGQRGQSGWLLRGMHQLRWNVFVELCRPGSGWVRCTGGQLRLQLPSDLYVVVQHPGKSQSVESRSMRNQDFGCQGSNLDQ